MEAAPAAAIFRIGVLPTAMAGLLNELNELARHEHADLIALTRASGIVYAAILAKEGDSNGPAALTGSVKRVFDACGKSEISASAMLEFCPAEVKLAVGGVWGASRKDFELMQRVKHSFDPHGVLSPGRFAGGI